MQFEWDENKRRANMQKHGIDFRKIDAVFRDPLAFKYPSSVPSGEARNVVVGKYDGKIVAVIYVEREHAIRIISARSARKEERQRYAGGIHR